MSLEIITNLIPRPVINGWNLNPSEKKEFDFMDEEELFGASFVRYLGEVFFLGDFMRISGVPGQSDFEQMKAWDGYQSDTYFSGILCKYSEDCEEVMMGRYFS